MAIWEKSSPTPPPISFLYLSMYFLCISYSSRSPHSASSVYDNLTRLSLNLVFVFFFFKCLSRLFSRLSLSLCIFCCSFICPNVCYSMTLFNSCRLLHHHYSNHHLLPLFPGSILSPVLVPGKASE